MKANRAPQSDIESAGRYLRIYFDVVAGKQSWEQFEPGWTPSPATLDPVPLFSRIKVPVLTMHGASDVDVRATANSSLYAKLSVHPDICQRVFDRADHFILIGVEDPDRQYRHLAPGYLQTLIDWSKKVGAAR